MSDEKGNAHVQEGYNPRPVAQALAEFQKGYNAQPLAQALAQLLQGGTGNCGNGATAPPSSTPTSAQGAGASKE